MDESSLMTNKSSIEGSKINKPNVPMPTSTKGNKTITIPEK